MGEILVGLGTDVGRGRGHGVVEDATREHGDEDAPRGVVEAVGAHRAVGELSGSELHAARAETGQVHAGLGGGDLVVSGPEVGNGEALETQVVLEEREQGGALTRERSVDLRIGHHDRRGRRRLHDAAEGAGVDLAQGSVGDFRVGGEAVRLLGVAGEVLDGGYDVLALHAQGDRTAELPGQMGVLAHSFGLAAEVPGPGDVHGRAQQVVVALGPAFGSDGGADVVQEIGVEGGCLGERHGEGGHALFPAQAAWRRRPWSGPESPERRGRQSRSGSGIPSEPPSSWRAGCRHGPWGTRQQVHGR